MKLFKAFAIALVLFLTYSLAVLAAVAEPLAEQYQESRYCGPPKRNSVGTIERDAKVPYYYRKVHRCPSTGLFTGACPNYALNHVIPLACGGCDTVNNLTWMRNDIKKQQDVIERRIYAAEPAIADTDACTFKITP